MNPIKIKVSLEKFGEKFNRPHKSEFMKWTQACLEYVRDRDLPQSQNIKGREILNLNVRLVTEEEMRQLSAKYRHKSDLATVLSFPCEDSIALRLPDLGDIVMCGKAIALEAGAYRTDVNLHWAHLFIHSVLHILGFEHSDAMRAAENDIMCSCDLPPVH